MDYTNWTDIALLEAAKFFRQAGMNEEANAFVAEHTRRLNEQLKRCKQKIHEDAVAKWLHTS